MEVRATVALDVVWIGLTVLAVLAFVASVASLVQGILLRGGVRRGMRLALGAFLPSVALILPVRGLDEGFDENLRALLSQAYPRYRLLVVADDSSDPAAARIETIARDFPRVPVARILSEANPLGGKVNALRSALGQLVPEDEVVVFADSDIRPAGDWLRQLVQPLADSTVGVATGFRWYVPPRPTFWGVAYLIPAALFFAPLPVSIAKASLRRRALFSGAPTVAAAWKVPAWRSAAAAMAVPWVMASGLLRTRNPTTLRWRGHTYDVSDPRQVRLIEAAEKPEGTS